MKAKICSIFKRIRYFLTPQIMLDAKLLDFMQEHSEVAPDAELEAPSGEFQKIMEEMERRGIKPAAKKQLKLKILLDRILQKSKKRKGDHYES